MSSNYEVRGPDPKVSILLRGKDEWMACSATEFGPTGQVRHIVAKGHVTTVCGCTASKPSIWRRNRTKPRCAECVRKYYTESNPPRST